ncbi:MAG: glycosyl hydrolase family 17 [Balneolaceae bacterium]|nr:glycosyl hydrolase family 17 [Balneolaceae bacterium]MBO6546658.1 glycosyl hydrolase family 17 [Balneolaceae bacterium]MBO6649016.1 glycosyl hydrolase family 17 [Balneolaceae bacterium]
MKRFIVFVGIFLTSIIGCASSNEMNDRNRSAEEILGNPDFQAISFGGFREKTRDNVPTVSDLKEDLRILDAIGIRVLRTYNTQQFPHAENLLKAIKELKAEDSNFEMYVMLGAWIDAKNAWTDQPVIHDVESLENNTAEIGAAVRLANEYPDIVKIIAVGNEAMVHWATSYFVTPDIILKWVNYLQDQKAEGNLADDVWITSSDNFASWGGGDESYHNEDLTMLFNAVDYVSVHTYPFHDTHYNSDFWLVPDEEENLSDLEKVDLAMKRARDYAKSQFEAVKTYMTSLGIDKPVHIGETGWASTTNSMYGKEGSRAADEYKQKLFYDSMRKWTTSEGISCFYFEAFDEQWKDPLNPMGSENHFGLINLKGEAKYLLWDEVDEGVFKGLSRGGNSITKTYNGVEEAMIEDVLPPLTSRDE